MNLNVIIKKKNKGTKISSPSNSKYRNEQAEVKKRIHEIVRQYDRSAEEAAKHYVRLLP